jgi:phosphate/sulfate permease
MIHQISLLIMLLAPVVAYVAGALLYSLIERVGKDAKQTKYNPLYIYKNGL